MTGRCCFYDSDLYDINLDEYDIVKYYQDYAIPNHCNLHFSRNCSLVKSDLSMFTVPIEFIIDMFITYNDTLKYKPHKRYTDRYWIRLDLDEIGVRPKTICQPGSDYTRNNHLRYLLLLRKNKRDSTGAIQIVTLFPRAHLDKL